MSFAESAFDGRLGTMSRYAVLNGALWAVGSAWSVAIRSVTLALLPMDAERVVGETLAAIATTLLAILVSYVVARDCTCRRDEQDPLPPPRPARRGASGV